MTIAETGTSHNRWRLSPSPCRRHRGYSWTLHDRRGFTLWECPCGVTVTM